MIKYKTFEEMEKLTESEVIKYSCFLMDRKLELANSVIKNEINSNDEKVHEANQISEQLKLLAEARRKGDVEN